MAIEEAAPKTKTEKDAAIAAAIKDLDKAIGPNTVIRLGDKATENLPIISTGVIPLDHTVLGCGGMPRGRIIEIFGPESSGKTSIALATIAAAQSQGGRAAIVDTEHALDPIWAATLGVNVEDLLVSQPDTAENALEVVKRLVDSKAIDVIVVDSVAALVPRAELEGDMGDAQMGSLARLMGQAMRKLTGPVAKAGVVLIFINQIREKIGVIFGSPETTPGGRALRFAASIRLDVRRKDKITVGEDLVGFKTKIKAIKNKCAPPFKETEVDLYFDRGFDRLGPLLDAAVDAGVVEKGGSWYSYKGERLGQGRTTASQNIEEYGFFAEISDAVGRARLDEQTA